MKTILEWQILNIAGDNHRVDSLAYYADVTNSHASLDYFNSWLS